MAARRRHRAHRLRLTGNAHAQAGNDSIPSLTLDSNEPGQLVINWQAPDPAPTDYRLSWTNSSLEFLSYKDPMKHKEATSIQPARNHAHAQ